jgi:ribosome biogenesis GTPase / thiamine phosphate phosphatase
MTLSDLGFDDWLQQRRDECGKPELTPSRITRVDRDRYLVRGEGGEVPAEATGRLLFSADSGEDLPCTGDWALVQYHNDGALAIIHDLLPRRTFLRRKAAGNTVDYQMIAANIDAAFIMQSCDDNFNLRRMERYVVMANDGHVEPVILLSKTDLLSPQELQQRIAEVRRTGIGSTLLAFSSTSGQGLDVLQQTLGKGKTYCLLGSSGVGKTTLLNHLLGREEFETQPVRTSDSRGRHTTSSRQLVMLDNGAFLIDTPGMRELGLVAAQAGLAESFFDISELSGECRFKDCTHTSEVGCAILEAVENGELDKDRYQSYLKLLKESQFHQMSYVERRRKDKQFGRMVKNVLKQTKKGKTS